MLHSDSLGALVLGLNQRFARADSDAVLDAVIGDNLVGQLALVSSFGAESAVLLHMAAKRRKDMPVLFIDTEFLFEETIDYLKTLAIDLGLEDVRRIVPDPVRTAIYDPNGDLHKRNQDHCCHLRKTLPLQRALGEFSGWITGRKRYQSRSRKNLEYFELDQVTNRIKVNPLFNWDMKALSQYMDTHKLPRHPLIAKGYPSIGCMPCTSRVTAGEAPRAGRWRGTDKVECGIHFEAGKLIRLNEKELSE